MTVCQWLNRVECWLPMWKVTDVNPSRVKPITYQIYTCRCLAWCSALIGQNKDWLAPRLRIKQMITYLDFFFGGYIVSCEVSGLSGSDRRSEESIGMWLRDLFRFKVCVCPSSPSPASLTRPGGVFVYLKNQHAIHPRYL